MNIKPIKNKVIVEVDAPDRITKGGIYIPKNTKNPRYMGTVIACNSTYEDEHGNTVQSLVKDGDRVIFREYAAIKIKVGMYTEYSVFDQENILAVIG
jgi:chaperonin GroES